MFHVVGGKDGGKQGESGEDKTNVEVLYDVNATMVPECMRHVVKGIEEGELGDKEMLVGVGVFYSRDTENITIYSWGRDTSRIETIGILTAAISALTE